MSNANCPGSYCYDCQQLTAGVCWRHSTVPPASTAPFKCPVCDGSGLVSRPPGVAGDVPSWVGGTVCTFECRACGGKGLVWR